MATRVVSPVLVARDRELAELRALHDGPVPGRPPVILVGGEAGVGKSRLVGAFVAERAAAGTTVLSGACVGGDRLVPYAPISEALRRLGRGLARDADEGLERPGDLAPVVDRIRAAMATPERSSSAGAAHLIDDVIALLERLAGCGPVLVVLEDLHWADPSTIDLVGHVARAVCEDDVLIVGTYRPEEIDPRRGALAPLLELERRRLATRLVLAPLDADGVRTLVAAIGGTDPDDDAVARLFARSGGNAFFVEELLAAGGPGTRPTGTLRDVLLARIATLGDRTQEVLRLASPAGVRFSGPLVEAAVGIDEREVLRAAREAVGRQVLVIRDDGGDRDAYEYRHALVQETLYDELLPAERRRLHAAYARALDEGAEGDASVGGQAASHWWLAGDRARALGAAVRAAGLAARVHAWSDAVAHYEHAIAAWPDVAPGERPAGLDEASLLGRAAEAAAAAGRPEAACAWGERAVGLVDDAAEPVRAGLLLERLGRHRAASGDGAGSLAARERSVALVPPSPPTAARARVMAGLARGLAQAGRYAESAAWARDALACARAAEGTDAEASCLGTLGVDEGYLGLVDDGVGHLEAARDLALAAGDDDEAIRAWCNLANLLEVAGRAEASAREGLRAAEEAEARGLGRAFAATALGIAAGALYELGRWDEALAALERVRRTGPEGDGALTYHMTSAWLHVGRGEVDPAERHLAAARSLFRPATREPWKVFIANMSAQLELDRGSVDAARAAVAEALPVLEGLEPGDLVETAWLLPTAVRVEADAWAVAVDRRDARAATAARARASELRGAAEALVERVIGALPALGRQPAAALALAVAESSRLGVPDPLAWRRAVTVLEEAPHPFATAYARYRLAEAVLLAGTSREEAVAELRAAHATASSLRAAPLLADIAALAARARVLLEEAPAAPAAGPDPFGLTAREREVLGLVAAGWTNRQIGARLFITEKTASVHVSNVMAKLGVTSRTAAAAVAHRAGIVPQTADGPPSAG